MYKDNADGETSVGRCGHARENIEMNRKKKTARERIL